MNIKRYLKKQAEQDKQKILDSDNGEFLHTLQSKIEPMPSKKRVPLRIWLPASLSAVIACVVLVICITVYYPFETGPMEYLDINIINEVSTIEELNKDVKEVNFQIDDALYTYTVTKASDSISSDVLYYYVTIDNPDAFVQMEIITVCNPRYTYKDLKTPHNPTIVQLPNYKVLYETSTSIHDEFGLEVLHATAEIHKGKESIYITDYSELLLSPSDSFLEILQSIVK